MAEIGAYEAMSTLRAVRRLRTDPIPEDVLRRVIQAACWAPTGGNNQPWRILAVRDPDKKRVLRDLYKVRWDAYAERYAQNMAKVSADLRAKQQRMLDAATHLAEHYHEAPVILMFLFNPESMAITDAELDRPSVVGGGSVYTAVQNLLLACRIEGLGCTLTTLLCYDEPRVRELLQIPQPWGTCAAVPIGYPARGGHGPIARRPPELMAFVDRWGDSLFGSEA